MHICPSCRQILPNTRAFRSLVGVTEIRIPAQSIIAARAVAKTCEVMSSMHPSWRPLVCDQLVDVERDLGHGYVRTHRAWVVRVGAVTAVDLLGRWLDVFKVGRVPISRRRAAAVRRALKEAGR